MMDNYFVRVLLTPSAVFLSVLFGPSYSSGTAVTQFMTVNGPTGGLVSIGTIAIAFAVFLSLSFELARMFSTYEYVGFVQVLLNRAWFIYEIVILTGIVIALSIAITIGGTILDDQFGVPIWVGSLGIFLMIVLLTYHGRIVVKKSMMVSVAALFLVLLVLVIQLVSAHLDEVVEVFTGTDHQAGGILSGLKYAVVSGGFIPLLLYCAIGLKTRREAAVAGIVAAIVSVIPALVFHFAFLADYPAIIDEPVPIYAMFELVSTPFMLNAYAAIMFVLIAQTGVGMQQGLVQRVDAWQLRRRGAPLTRNWHAAIAAATAIVSVALGTMGVVALILRGYALLFVSFIVVFIVPLLTYGVYLVFRRNRSTASLT